MSTIVGAGGDHHVDHVVADQLGIEVHAAARRGRAGDDERDRTIRIGEHHVVDFRRAAEVAAREAHLLHRVDDRARVEAGDVDMLDLGRQQLRLAGVVDRGFGHGNLHSSVRAELVEAHPSSRKGTPFDKLRANGD